MPHRVRDRVRVAAVGVLVLALSAACSSSGADPTPSPPPVSGPGSVSGTPADAVTLAAISSAYATFFAATSSAAQSQRALQHGDMFVAALAEQAKSSYASRSSARVTSASLSSPDLAAVTFTVSSGGNALLSEAPGYAVRTNGRWQVAAQTFCGLLQLQGDAPAACHDDAVTALPH